VRLFVARGMEVLVAQSYSKNLGLYAERIGAINVISSSPESAARYSKLSLPFFLISEVEWTCLGKILDLSTSIPCSFIPFQVRYTDRFIN